MTERQMQVGTDSEGNRVELPTVEVLTGRGFVTGKSGSGKSNTASVIAEKLLDEQLGLLIVDIDGEYYGLKEEYEILHVGADEECDLVVNEEHAGKLAELALEQNVPIILDVSSFLDESNARDLLTAVARNLFAKEKKLKQPFLLVVEEVHEYIPEGGGLDECGRMLIKAAKRGRKHGLGVVGVSQRPADVKKDFITQCDWLVWHRLTWENDTKVVRRILGSEYADAIEGMGDGEAFVLTDWSERVRRVQFDRKETFDAGATPGLDDFQRPELKSVSSDLVQDLEAISEAEERRESRIQELERKLADRDERIEELEERLSEAKDLSKMAERFSRAMMEHASGRAFRADVTEGVQTEMDDWRKRAVRGEHMEATRRPAHPPADYEGSGTAADGSAADAVEATPGEPETETTPPAGWPETAEDDADAPEQPGPASGPSDPDGPVDIDAAFEALTGAAGEAADRDDGGATPGVASSDGAGGAARDSGSGDGAGGSDLPGGNEAGGWPEFTGEEPSSDADDATSDGPSTVERVVEESDPGFEREVVREVKGTVRGFDDVTRRMLAHYRANGPDDPVDAHVAAGGDGDRTRAYSRNRTLRQADLVAHAGRGTYGYRLPARIQAAHDDRLTDAELADAVAAVEKAFVAGGDAAPATDSAGTAVDGPAPATGDDVADSASDAEAAADVLAPDDDAEFIDADAVRDDDEETENVPPLTGVGGATGADDARGDESGTDSSVADAPGSGSEQFRASEERTASDGGETDDFPKWPGE